MKIKSRSILLTAILGVGFSSLLFQCSSKTESTTAAGEAGGVTQSGSLTLSAAQMERLAIVTRKPEMQALTDGVRANGMLDVPPQNLVTISAPLGGFVKHTELLQGVRVSKGQTLAVMEHPDYIQLQQDYLDGKSQLEFLEGEYHRQEALAKDNVNAAKTLQQAKSNYLSMKARVEGGAARLRLIGLVPEQLEQGSIQPVIKIASPISGFVTQVHVNIGMYVSPNDVMFKIVDSEHLHAEVTIFERDINKVKLGQLIRLTMANETTERLATVYLIGKEISSDRTVRIHGHLKKEDTSLLPGMFFSAVIETDPQSVIALPSSAFVSFEGNTYAFVDRGNQTFQMIQVTTGTSSNNFTELKGGDPGLLYVTKGAFDLLSMLKNASDE